MIEMLTGWRCTLCGHSVVSTQLTHRVPKTCPACNDGKNTAFVAWTRNGTTASTGE